MVCLFVALPLRSPCFPTMYFSTHLVYKHKAGLKTQLRHPTINQHVIRPGHGEGMGISRVRVGLFTG